MINDFELNNEKDYLKIVFEEVQNQKEKVSNSLDNYKKRLKQQVEYAAESFYDMDEEEVSATKTILENQELEIVNIDYLRRLNLIKNLPILEN